MENAIRSNATVAEINEARLELRQMIQLLCDNFQKKFAVFPEVSTKEKSAETKAGTFVTHDIVIKVYF